MIAKMTILYFAIVSILFIAITPTTYAAFTKNDSEKASVSQLYCAAETQVYADKQKCFETQNPPQPSPNYALPLAITVSIAICGALVTLLYFKSPGHKKSKSIKQARKK